MTRKFSIGDRVRITSGDKAGYVGVIGRRPHPATSWDWVVYNERGPDIPFWGAAVNEDDIEHAPAESVAA